MGLSPGLMKLFADYVYDRYLYVQYHGFRSVRFHQRSGVPQGSILGPLFFDIFINNITSGLDVHFLMYADDLKLYTEITFFADCERLQGTLNLIES